MNKFKKKTRSKMIAASIAILSSAAVVSTGFAAWVISGGDSEDVSGTITADEVSNQNHLIDNLTGGTQSIVFGGPMAEDITSNAESLVSEDSRWLKNEGQTEKLKAVWTFDVFGFESKPDDNGRSVLEITFTEGAATKNHTTFAVAVTKGYVAALPQWGGTILDSANSVGTDSGIYLVTNGYADKKMSYTLTVVFAWGSKFGGMNPYFYYNQKNPLNNDKASANTYLSELSNMSANFTLTIKTKAN